MKRLLPVLMGFVVLLLSSTEGWSLPPCKGSPTKYSWWNNDGWTNCFGTLTHANGNIYVGEFQYGNYHGQGTYTYANGIVREGTWENGEFLYAKKTSPTVIAKKSPTKGSSLPPCPGSPTYWYYVYKNWTDCIGIHTYANEKYVGEFKDGKEHGQGTYIYANKKYVGGFEDGKRNGQGTTTYASGNKHVGEYKDGKKHGQGTLTSPSGSKYVGEFQYGNAYGQGTYTDANGRVKEGMWENNKLLTAKYALTMGSSLPLCVGNYTGTIWTDCFGTYTYPNRNKYVGEFKYGAYHGQGTFTYASGSKYVGEYKDGKQHGQGTYTDANGRVKEGMWENDKFKTARD